MAQIRPEELDPVVQRLVILAREPLSRSEYAELFRVAQGIHCAEAARAAGISYETIRARRKRIYRKLRIGSANEIVSCMLRIALSMLSAPNVARPGLGEPGPAYASARGDAAAPA